MNVVDSLALIRGKAIADCALADQTPMPDPTIPDLVAMAGACIAAGVRPSRIKATLSHLNPRVAEQVEDIYYVFEDWRILALRAEGASEDDVRFTKRKLKPVNRRADEAYAQY